MTYERPDWADSLKNALIGLAQQVPRPLRPLLAVMSGGEVSDEALINFIANGDYNDPARTQLRMTLAKWDADEDSHYESEPRSGKRQGGEILLSPRTFD